MPKPDTQLPWYQRCKRWGQTNLTEINAKDYDDALWRKMWRETGTQGIIVNAGGIVAYYPSRFPHHYRAKFLDGRDLFGEICAAAREEGIEVVARMDSSRAIPEFFEAHPDWFVYNVEGEAVQAHDRYLACVNSPYFSEYIPALLCEIIERYAPVGFTDNSWTGVGRNCICHCRHCQEKFKDDTGLDLPRELNWDDPVYRAWISWSYQCRLDVWERNNRVTREAGGEDCVWLGMVNSDPILGHVNFADLDEIGRRTPVLFCDQQSRTGDGGFEQNALAGKILHEAAGWDAPVMESMALYARGPQGNRLAAAPPEESRMWMIEGIAGGISPWWHIVNARVDDRRKLQTAQPLYQWHARHEDALFNREPVATVGVLWSHENVDFFGRDEARELVLLPFRGWTKALTRARIPYLPVHARHIRRQIGRLQTLILPAIAVLSDDEIEALREFSDAGGHLIVTGYAGCLDVTGAPRPNEDNPLPEFLGFRFTDSQPNLFPDPKDKKALRSTNTYLRIESGTPLGSRFAQTFSGTDILGFGGALTRVQPTQVAGSAPLTSIPEFIGYPPEFSWMPVEQTDTPALIAREHESGSRTVFLAADIDRCFGRAGFPDHGDLLADALLWTLDDELPLRVDGPGTIDCHLYQQGDRRILHLINLSGANQWPAYLEEHLPIGPITITPQGQHAIPPESDVQALVRTAEDEQEFTVTQENDLRSVTLDKLTHHQVLTWVV